ncbi:MAG: N-acetylmuramoyl-L-alanine amidase [Clostridia bacterium]|nr:N-acetylmuramoyl-L-alanine amidase [Clostridia bacterium]
MKKGFYFAFDFKRLCVIIFSAVLIASGIECVRYSTLSTATANIKDGSTVIIVDAGHGGADGGAQSSAGILEKDINLAVAKKVGNILSLMGYRVVYTREKDSIDYPDECATIKQKKVWDTHDRMSVIEKYPDGIFLSIHQNYFTESIYSGAQVFYSGNNAESEAIAKSIQKAIVSDIQPENERQVKQSGTEIYLLYHAKIPAVMVECGFLSNEKEAMLLSDNSYQTKMAISIVRGITEYINGINEV